MTVDIIGSMVSYELRLGQTMVCLKKLVFVIMLTRRRANKRGGELLLSRCVTARMWRALLPTMVGGDRVHTAYLKHVLAVMRSNFRKNRLLWYVVVTAVSYDMHTRLVR